MIHGLFSDSVGFTILNMTFGTEQLGINGNLTDWLTAIGTISSAIGAWVLQDIPSISQEEMNKNIV